jgi:pimeloyl-ACP methyl ester carboxylesterase
VKPVVVFLHGLARTHRSLTPLRKRIEAAGYDTWARSYPSRRMPVAELATTVAEWVRKDVGDTPVLGVTHSLGGILARHIGEQLVWKGLVMLAPPNRGSRVAKALRFHPLYRWFYGPAGQELADHRAWPAPPRPFAVIAGTAGVTLGNPPSWAVRSLKILPAEMAHDGTVAVDETKLPGMVGYAEVPASHTFIMSHPRTVELVLHFLEHQRFEDEGDD